MLENGARCNIDKAKFRQHVAALKMSQLSLPDLGGRDSLQSQVSKRHGAVGAWRQLSEVAETRVKTKSALCFCPPENYLGLPSFLSPAYLKRLFVQAVRPALPDSPNWPHEVSQHITEALEDWTLGSHEGISQRISQPSDTLV